MSGSRDFRGCRPGGYGARQRVTPVAGLRRGGARAAGSAPQLRRGARAGLVSRILRTGCNQLRGGGKRGVSRARPRRGKPKDFSRSSFRSPIPARLVQRPAVGPESLRFGRRWSPTGPGCRSAGCDLCPSSSYESVVPHGLDSPRGSELGTRTQCPACGADQKCPGQAGIEMTWRGFHQTRKLVLDLSTNPLNTED